MKSLGLRVSVFAVVWTVFAAICLGTAVWAILKTTGFGARFIDLIPSLAPLVIFGLGQWLLLRWFAPIPFTWGLFAALAWSSGSVTLAFATPLLCVLPTVLVFSSGVWLNRLLSINTVLFLAGHIGGFILLAYSSFGLGFSWDEVPTILTVILKIGLTYPLITGLALAFIFSKPNKVERRLKGKSHPGSRPTR